ITHDCRLEEPTRSVHSRATAENTPAVAACVGDLLLEHRKLLLPGKGTDEGTFVLRIAYREPANLLGQRGGESGGDGAAHVDSRDRAAALPVVIERALGHGLGGGSDVDIVADVNRVLSAKLQLDGDHPPGRLLRDALAGGERAGEEHTVHIAI